jgi:hypothetical protein
MGQCMIARTGLIQHLGGLHRSLNSRLILDGKDLDRSLLLAILDEIVGMILPELVILHRTRINHRSTTRPQQQTIPMTQLFASMCVCVPSGFRRAALRGRPAEHGPRVAAVGDDEAVAHQERHHGHRPHDGASTTAGTRARPPRPLLVAVRQVVDCGGELRREEGVHLLPAQRRPVWSTSLNASSSNAAALASCRLLPLLPMTRGANARAWHTDLPPAHEDPAPPSPTSSSRSKSCHGGERLRKRTAVGSGGRERERVEGNERVSGCASVLLSARAARKKKFSGNRPHHLLSEAPPKIDCRDVIGSDRILLLPYPQLYFFTEFGAKRIVIGCGFQCRYIGPRIRCGNRTDSDRK